MTKMRASMVGLVMVGWVTTAAAQEAKPAASAPPAPASSETTHVMVQPKDLKWGPAPPALPKGAKVAVVQGDLKSGPWAIRAEFPPNYKIMPHTHPSMEHVTVISGAFSMGMGEKFDEKAMTKLPPGGFAAMPAGMAHYAMSNGKTIIQVHGNGAFELKYIDPKDDPRNAAPAAAAAPAPAK